MSSVRISPDHAIWIALRLPFLDLEAHYVDADVDAHVLISHKNRIVCATRKSLKEVRLGTPTSTAQMTLQAQVLALDEGKSQALLKQCADTVYDFTPHYECYRGQGLLLEISSCLKLFNNDPQALLDRLLAALRRQHRQSASEGGVGSVADLHIALGVAHTRLGAWMLSFKPSTTVDFEHLPQQALSALRACEIDYLPESAALVERLQKTGFRTLEDLLRQNSFELRDRYGSGFIDRIGEVLGLDLVDKTLTPTQKTWYQRPIQIPREPFNARVDLDRPADNLPRLQPVFQHLLLQLKQYLVRHQQQCHQIHWHLFNIYGEESRHALNIPSLHAQWEFALELTRLHFENTTLPFEVDALALSCPDTLPQEGATPSLFGDAGNSQDEQKLLIKLRARLGKDAICQLQHVDSHVPEAATRQITASAPTRRASHACPSTPVAADRPVWMLHTPQRLHRSKQGLFYRGRLRLLSGPERIQQLWGEQIVWRDYYIAQQEDAARLWVFQDLCDQRWYLHGLF